VEIAMAFTLESAAFNDGESIPKDHTCEGPDISPALNWSGEPEGTESFALIVEDPDAPRGTWNHWLLWDIPAGRHELAQRFRTWELGVSGSNDFGRLGYGGPCPPRGHGSHRYFFRLHALAVGSVKLREGSKRAEVEKAIAGHVLATAELMGRYERR
jgi:Raf kinase inhibitor-like YbhB/YbcL family protein